MAEYEHLSESKIRKIVKKYSNTGRMNKETRGGRTHIKATDDIKMFIRDMVHQNCAITLNQISLNVSARFNLVLSISTIFDFLDKIHDTFKSIM